MAVPGITVIACLAVVVVWLLVHYGRSHHPELLVLLDRFIDDESPLEVPELKKPPAKRRMPTNGFRWPRRRSSRKFRPHHH